MKNQVQHRDVCKIILSLTTVLLMLSLTGCGAKRTEGLVSAEGGAEELTAAVGQNATGGDDKITAANAAAVPDEAAEAQPAEPTEAPGRVVYEILPDGSVVAKESSEDDTATLDEATISTNDQG